MSELLPVGIHFGVPVQTYRMDPGINYSTISAFVKADSPKHFKWQRDHPEPVDPDYLRIGAAIDCLIWDAEQFSTKFAICPDTYPCEPNKKDMRDRKPWIWSAQYCKDWRDTVVKAGLSYLTAEERDRVRGLVDGAQENEDIWAIIQHSEKQAVIIANHPVHGFRMKCAVDLWPKTHSQVCGTHMWDFKSEGQSAAPAKFNDKARKVNYHLQAAHYMRCAIAIGFPIQQFGFCVVESNPPHDSKINYFNWGQKEIVTALETFDAAALQYLKCVETGKWPGLSRDWSNITYPQYYFRTPEGGEVLV